MAREILQPARQHTGAIRLMVALMAPQAGVPADVVATWLGRSQAGTMPVTLAIVDSQQKVADLLYREK